MTDTPETAPPITRLDPGPRASGIVVHGGVAYFTTIPDRPFGGSAAEQTRQILRRVEERLARLGSGKSRILATQIWLSDIRYFAEMNEVWDAWIDPLNPPSRACCAVELANPDLKVEMVMTAAVP
jgi:enamine deaminase RidA (YjgF/YER057c/UK114 family)